MTPDELKDRIKASMKEAEKENGFRYQQEVDRLFKLEEARLNEALTKLPNKIFDALVGDSTETSKILVMAGRPGSSRTCTNEADYQALQLSIDKDVSIQKCFCLLARAGLKPIFERDTNDRRNLYIPTPNPETWLDANFPSKK